MERSNVPARTCTGTLASLSREDRKAFVDSRSAATLPRLSNPSSEASAVSTFAAPAAAAHASNPRDALTITDVSLSGFSTCEALPAYQIAPAQQSRPQVEASFMTRDLPLTTWKNLSSEQASALIESRSTVGNICEGDMSSTSGGSRKLLLMPPRSAASLFQASPDSKTSDLLFLIDATGSMANVIMAATDKVQEIVKQAAEAPYPDNGWTLRMGFIAYRDFGIAPQFVVKDFTSSAADFRHALIKVKAFSTRGRDTPEDVFGAIEIASMCSWESVSRTIIHIADAPCHGMEYHKYAAHDDNYADGDPLGRNLKVMFDTLKTYCKVSEYRFMHINRKETQKMIDVFKKIAGDNEYAVPWIQECDLHNARKDLVALVSQSISVGRSFSQMPRS